MRRHHHGATVTAVGARDSIPFSHFSKMGLVVTETGGNAQGQLHLRLKRRACLRVCCRRADCRDVFHLLDPKIVPPSARSKYISSLFLSDEASACSRCRSRSAGRIGRMWRSSCCRDAVCTSSRSSSPRSNAHPFVFHQGCRLRGSDS